MLVVERTDPSAAVAHGVDAFNNSLGFADPASMFRYFSKTSFSPNGINWGHYADPLGRRPAPAGSGQIDQLGDGVSGFQIGDRVADMTVVGSNAAYRTLRADRLDLRLGP